MILISKDSQTTKKRNSSSSPSKYWLVLSLASQFLISDASFCTYPYVSFTSHFQTEPAASNQLFTSSHPGATFSRLILDLSDQIESTECICIPSKGTTSRRRGLDTVLQMWSQQCPWSKSFLLLYSCPVIKCTICLPNYLLYLYVNRTLNFGPQWLHKLISSACMWFMSIHSHVPIYKLSNCYIGSTSTTLYKIACHACL